MALASGCSVPSPEQQMTAVLSWRGCRLRALKRHQSARCEPMEPYRPGKPEAPGSAGRAECSSTKATWSATSICVTLKLGTVEVEYNAQVYKVGEVLLKMRTRLKQKGFCSVLETARVISCCDYKTQLYVATVSFAELPVRGRNYP